MVLRGQVRTTATSKVHQPSSSSKNITNPFPLSSNNDNSREIFSKPTYQETNTRFLSSLSAASPSSPMEDESSIEHLLLLEGMRTCARWRRDRCARLELSDLLLLLLLHTLLHQVRGLRTPVPIPVPRSGKHENGVEEGGFGG